MHWDKDEGKWMRERVMSHPALSSVFYLSQVGGPTLVAAQRVAEDHSHLSPLVPAAGVACEPRPNRLLFFDGGLLHGVLPAHIDVPSDAEEDEDGEIEIDDPFDGQRRLTLLMNFWVYPLRDELCQPLPRTRANRRRYGTPLEGALGTAQCVPAAVCPPLLCMLCGDAVVALVCVVVCVSLCSGFWQRPSVAFSAR